MVYLLGAAFNFGQGFLLAGVTQRTMYGLRRDVEQKLGRLPLQYFDSHPHGDILSRVSNDIDNLTTTIQQGLSQLLTSVLTIVGVLGMMIWISPLLAAVSLITIPLAILITVIIAKRSQVQFADQWERTGTLNGLVEETHTGHGLVQVFGRRPATIDEFERQNRRLYEASFRAQFLSGMVNLLVRFYEIDAGHIRLDGTDYAELTRDEVRRVTWLFEGTIRDNIAYGRGGATDEEIIDAATAAYVDHFVRTLPDGYATRLDADASNFSSGQKQLLTIARAFLASPPILILDEATSNVDTRTEVLIQEAMARLRQGRTSFVIAHRLSTIRNADTIIVMDAGRIVEHGDHAQLLARRGMYYSLYNSQFTEAFNPVG